jgi:hypothetical protein
MPRLGEPHEDIVAIVSILGQISGQLNTLFDGVESDLKPKAG